MLSVIRFVKKTAEIRAKIEVKVRVRHKVGVCFKKRAKFGVQQNLYCCQFCLAYWSL